MAKTNHFKTVVFTQDYATKKQGEEWPCDSLLASQLVNGSKVAEYKTESLSQVKEKETLVEKPVIKIKKIKKEK